jgi:membrane-associated phospholipid phosphatase
VTTAPAEQRATRLVRAWPLIALALAILVLTYGFAKFGSEVVERETLVLDHGVRDWVLAHRTPAGSAFFRTITWLGSMVVLIPATLMVLWLLHRRGARWRPLLLALGTIVFAIVVSLLKTRYQIVRPPAGLSSGLGFSFPSGHASSSAAAWLVLTYILVREGIVRREALVFAALLALLVGSSRVYLDLHWTSDVLGGWAVGLTAGLAACALYAALIRRAKRKQAAASSSRST